MLIDVNLYKQLFRNYININSANLPGSFFVGWIRAMRSYSMFNLRIANELVWNAGAVKNPQKMGLAAQEFIFYFKKQN